MIAKESSRNKLQQAIPLLATLLRRDPDVEHAYLCHQNAVQISKLKNEGNHFCAYRNIQMILAGKDRDYSIPEIQTAIEKAWEAGHNSHGRIETGGIVGTRKHIGTSEAEALLQSLSIPCEARAFSGRDAHQSLLEYVQSYFSVQTQDDLTDYVQVSAKHPIFLQRPRHSLTIVGIERLRNGKRRLIVFDPGYQPPSSVRTYLTGERDRLPSLQKLRLYCRNERYLRKYGKFETLARHDAPIEKQSN
ncbi:hypothetical protein K461DRAFT_278211 [Myriangium duriaei CBS 260.36]|uniref:UFSP1/2/DUB catalytic domain-containing protein n=1 Tax=Myriangium duriaei CBS 260.36 TaxID=1168546 RepID=A0A9P4J0U2_9PEZI|nr:hypothetical protein K461DRAFT_278211 [Myriangium duriaei CBS 260.36]